MGGGGGGFHSLKIHAVRVSVYKDFLGTAFGISEACTANVLFCIVFSYICLKSYLPIYGLSFAKHLLREKFTFTFTVTFF